MRLFGYDIDPSDDERERPRTMREVTLLVTADELRTIAGFLCQCANDIDTHGARFGHAHLSDHVRPATLDGDLIVVGAAPAATP